ncbi:MAG: FAD-dependent oxidoreductase [Treponemataceae bacterium]
MKRLWGYFSIISIILFVGCTAKSFEQGTYQGSARGFKSDVSVEIVLSTDKIESITIVDHDETNGIGSVAIEKLPAQIIERQSLNVDAISGATLTSNAIKKAITEALKMAGLKPSDLKAISQKNVNSSIIDVEETTDIVVIGGGGAGMSAALEAHAAGKKVLIVEKTSMLGGNTVRATGGMNATDTQEQARDDIADSIEIFVNDTMTSGKNINNRDLVMTMAKNSADAIEWLKTIGIKLTDVGLFGGASQKRIHRPLDDKGKVLAVGSYMVPIFEKNIKDANIKVLFNTTATEIIMNDGVIAGIKAKDTNKNYTINAKAIIITKENVL